MSVLRVLPAAVLLLGLLAPLSAAAQSRTTDPGGAASDDALFVLEGDLVDLTPTPEELAAAPLGPPAAAAASALAEEALTAYPNPAAGRATIRFALDAAAPVRLAVYDLLGREVAVLADGPAEAGPHEVAFDGSGLARGLYVVRFDAGGAVHTLRLTLMR